MTQSRKYQPLCVPKAHKKVLTTQIHAIHGVAAGNEDVSFANMQFSVMSGIPVAVYEHSLE